MSAVGAPIVVGPGQGPAYWVLGDQITFKLGSDQTGGRYALAETTAVPGGGPPPHVHAREDELFYVLDGDFEFTLAEQTFRGSAGFAINLPKGVVHQFRNVGSGPGRFLVATTPGGFDAFIVECGKPCIDPKSPPAVGPADIQKVMATCPKYGIEMRPDWRPRGPGPVAKPSKPLSVLGEEVNLLLSGPETGGACSVARVTFPPGTSVCPHRHLQRDEMIYVLDGTLDIMLGDAPGRPIRAEPGAFFHIPRNTRHGLSNSSRSPARMFDYHTPAGFEDFFREVDGVTDKARLAAMFAKHGIDMPM